MLSVGVGVGVSHGALASVVVPATPSYAGLQSVNTDGFTIEDNDTTAVGWGTNQNQDVNGVPQNNYDQTDVIYVKRTGFSGVNVAANPIDQVHVMSRFRQRHPNGSLWEAVNATPDPDEVRSTLSDFIYSSDVITDSLGVSAGITNSSTLSYPKMIPRWLNAPYTRVSAAGGDKIRVFVAHAYARNGKPIAGCQISVTDGTTTETYDATTLTKHTFSGSGLTVPCYEFSPDWSAFDTDTLLTIDFLGYPFVGDVYQASVDGDNTSHVARFGVLRVWNLSTTIRYAAVATTGSSGASTYTTAAAAEADPFDTILNAAQALETHGGGTCANAVVLIENGTHVVAQNLKNIAVSDAGIVFERASGATQAGCIVRSANYGNKDGLPDISHWKNLTIDKDDATFNERWSSNASEGSKNYLCIENVNFTLTGAGASVETMFSDCGIMHLIDCTGAALGQGRVFSSSTQRVNAYGCQGGAFADESNTLSAIVNCVGCDAQGTTSRVSAGSQAGSVIAFNKLSIGVASGRCMNTQTVVTARGLAIVGNVFESHSLHADTLWYVNADSNTDACQNVVAQQNTAVGARLNWCYAPGTSLTVAKSGFLRNCIVDGLNTKSDIFDNNGLSQGNETELYRVGDRNIMNLSTSSTGDFFAPGQWQGDVRPLNTTDGQAGRQNPGFANDQSSAGGDAGGGDYTPTIANMVNDLVPANDVCYPCDLDGTNWALDGTDAKGALVAA